MVSICQLLYKISSLKSLQFFSLIFSSYMYRLISVTFPLFDIHVRSLFCIVKFHEFPYGLAVRILGFHPGGLGSTPGMGTHFLVYKLRRCFPCFFYQGLRLVTVNLSK